MKQQVSEEVQGRGKARWSHLEFFMVATIVNDRPGGDSGEVVHWGEAWRSIGRRAFTSCLFFCQRDSVW
jgi:hypothetical protein